jgi:hypothetical protein
MPIYISLINLLGQEERILLNETREAGEHTLQFDVSGLNSGVYFVKLTSDKIKTCKIIIE